MTIPCEVTGDLLIARPQGQLNSTNAAAAEAQLLAHVAASVRRVGLDFAQLDYISSAGLRVVLVLAKRLKQAGGKLVLFGMQPHVREVFEVSGFLAILNVSATREQALAALD